MIFENFTQAIRAAYGSGQEDEALEPIVRVDARGGPYGRIGNGDSVIFYDVRGEREVELTESLIDPGFTPFATKKLKLNFVTLIEYSRSLAVRVAFPPEERLRNTLAEVLSTAGFRVVKISESEKAIHVAYFFNGKNESAFAGEERVVIPSPQTADYASVPGMSAEAVADAVERALATEGPEIIIANVANVDVVGHIEDRRAVLSAVETVDRVLGRIVGAARKEKAVLVATADHGTVEEWLYPDGQVNTGHTKNPVPFILADFRGDGPAECLRGDGELADVAPTLLALAGIAVPPEMTGRSLLLPAPGSADVNDDRSGAGHSLVSRGRTAGNQAGTKVLLLVLDGWGLRKDTFGNMIHEARTPNFNLLWSSHPHAVLASFGEAVGMPPGTVGNSEAGHLHLGAGRRVLLDRVKIDRAVADGSFSTNDAFAWAMSEAKRGSRALHLMGIVSHYSSHGTIDHLFALLKTARERGVPRIFVHGFIGRRGERPESGALYVAKVEEVCRELGSGEVVTVMGRHWSLDREENWDRIEKAYRALVDGVGTNVAGTFDPAVRISKR